MVTGEVDMLPDGHRIVGIHGGDPLMTKVVGTGCIIGGYRCLLCATRRYAENVASACHWMKQAGERAVAEARAR